MGAMALKGPDKSVKEKGVCSILDEDAVNPSSSNSGEPRLEGRPEFPSC